MIYAYVVNFFLNLGRIGTLDALVDFKVENQTDASIQWSMVNLKIVDFPSCNFFRLLRPWNLVEINN